MIERTCVLLGFVDVREELLVLASSLMLVLQGLDILSK
jgi:hypothetical protein